MFDRNLRYVSKYHCLTEATVIQSLYVKMIVTITTLRPFAFMVSNLRFFVNRNLNAFLRSFLGLIPILILNTLNLLSLANSNPILLSSHSLL